MRLTLGVVSHSLGHAALAATAGLLARAVTASATSLPYAGPMAALLFAASPPALAYFGLGAAFVKAGSGAILAHSERRLAAYTANRLREEVLAAVLGRRSSPPPPRILATLSVGLHDVEDAVSEGVLAGIRAAAQLVPLGVCLVVLSPAFALAALAAIAPFGIALALLRTRTRRTGTEAHALVAELERGVDELVRNADLFRTYGASDRVLDALRRSGARAGAAAARVERDRALLSGANEVLGALAVVGLVVVSAHLGGRFPGAAAVPFAAVFFMAYRPLRDLGDARAWVQRGAVAEAAVFAALAHEDPEPLPATEKPFAGSRAGGPELELRAYGALDRGPTTSLGIERGEIVALVGPTGSGKTTLLRALLGLERPAGTLLFEGRDVTRAPVGPAARPFAWVPQDAPLVTGTVLDNVCLLGGSHADARDALAAISATHLATDDGEVGPSGRPLSGGERRQVAIARALATGLPVLLLDEPTEGLDAEAARSVRDAVAALRGRRTVIVATHREDVVAVADRVVSLGGSDATSRAAE